MAEKPTSQTEDQLSYEAAREELVEVVRRLEAGGTTLEESLALWERGEQLARSARSGSTAPASGSTRPSRRTTRRTRPCRSRWRRRRPTPGRA